LAFEIRFRRFNEIIHDLNLKVNPPNPFRNRLEKTEQTRHQETEDFLNRTNESKFIPKLIMKNQTNETVPASMTLNHLALQNGSEDVSVFTGSKNTSTLSETLNQFRGIEQRLNGIENSLKTISNQPKSNESKFIQLISNLQSCSENLQKENQELKFKIEELQKINEGLLSNNFDKLMKLI